MISGLQNPAMLGLILAAIPFAYIVFRTDETEKKIVGAAKIATIFLLAIAAASPYISTTEQLSEQPTVTVLVDDSTSTELMNEYSLDLEGVETVQKTIATGNESELREGILQNIDEDTPYLLVSDGQGTEPLDDLASSFRTKNSTLHALRPEMKKDASVTIKGPSSTVIGAENSYTVEVGSTNGTVTPMPEVQVDGEAVELQREQEGIYTFTRSFDSEQDHTIQASIGTEDHFSSNNEYYKTVDVTEKPEILVIGDRADLADELEEFYDLTFQNSIPEDLSRYYAVIAKEQFEEDQLADYITQGNGLVYTGDYEQDNELLPVREVPEEQQSEGAKLVLLIDVSLSTGTSGSVKKSKQIGYSIADRLPYNNRVGLVAYNEEAYLAREPVALAENRDELKRSISRLETGGNSFHHNGLKGARKALNGTGNIIMVSDGRITQYGQSVNTEAKSRSIASDLNVRLITVGVGDNPNKRFLEDIAERGNGQYLDASESGRLDFLFAGGGTEDRAKSLVVVDSSHFITSGLETSAAVGSFDPVETKLSADKLVTSTDGNPALSTWRYGLGRVAAFSAGSKDLGRISANDPELVSRTVSWAVGQPQRKEDRVLTVNDARHGESVEAEATYEVEGLNRQGENLYTAQLSPGNPGFHSFKDDIYGYSYSKELEDIGYSEELENIVESTGGQTFKPSEREEIKSELEKFSNREIQTEKPLSDYFILAALIMFLSEVGYRKLNGRK